MKMKRILIVIALLFVGCIGGTLLGTATGGIGGGFIGLCMYNEVALSVQAITPEGAEKTAQGLAQKIQKSQGQLQWIVESAEIDGSEGCAKFIGQVKTELKNLGPAKK